MGASREGGLSGRVRPALSGVCLPMVAPADPGWTERDSATYQDLARVAVPDREMLFASILALLPYAPESAFRIVDLGCGGGELAEAALTCFPEATAVCLDGSESMLSLCRRRLDRFGGRARVLPFALGSKDWHEELRGAGAVISVLCLHHLDGEGKRDLFGEISRLLEARGCLLVGDLLEPRSRGTRRLWAEIWDRAVRSRSVELQGSEELSRRFQHERWNLYRHPDPEVDTPSPLSMQLRWLEEAGFEGVDCFHLRAGHALYGGFMPGASRGASTLGLDQALAALPSRAGSRRRGD